MILKNKYKVIMLVIWLFMACCFYALYSPGLLSPDSWDQLSQALTGKFNNWQPAIMQILWHWLIPVFGVSALLLFHVALYFLSLILLSFWFINRFRVFPVSIILLGLFPTSLYVLMWVWKDVGFAVVLFIIVVQVLVVENKNKFVHWVILLMLFWYVINVRIGNSFVVLPILYYLISKSYVFSTGGIKNRVYSFLTSIIIIVCSLVFQMLINAYYDVKPNNASHPYYIDMVATLVQTGKPSAINEFPDYLMKDPKKKDELVILYKKDPYWADNFAWGPASKLVYPNIGSKVVAPYLRIISAHPLAYLEHRIYFGFYLLMTKSIVWSAIKTEDCSLNEYQKSALNNNIKYINTEIRGNMVTGFFDKYVNILSFLYMPLIHFIFAVITLCYFTYKRQFTLISAISSSILLYFCIMFFFCPIIGETRYFYWVYLLNNFNIWLLYMRFKYNIAV